MEQSDVLMELGKIGAARRGQLSEQWYEVAGKDGEIRKTGPYYVLARCVGGEKTFARVPRDEAARVKEDLERGKAAAALISEFWANAEALADEKKRLAGRGAEAVGSELRQAAAQLEAAAKAGEIDLSWVEETLKTAAMHDAARILGKFYTEVLPRVLGVDQPDGGHGTRTRTLLSTVGPVEITRAYVVDGDGERSFPLDGAMGLVGGCTPAAAGLACWAGAQSASYDLAGAALSRLAGLAVPGCRVQRLVNLCAEDAAAWAAKRKREDHAGGILNTPRMRRSRMPCTTSGPTSPAWTTAHSANPATS